MSILLKVTPFINTEDPLNKLYVENIVSDPIFNKREKKIIEHYLTKTDCKLKQQQVIDKVAMYFGYEKKIVYQAISTLYEHWEGITERAVEKTTVEYETIKKEPSLAGENYKGDS